MGPTHPSTRTIGETFIRKRNESIDSFISIINTKKQADLLQISILEYVSLEVEMKATRDPECAEVSHLIKVCELTGKNVLEIGCGEGKFTRQYAGMPSRLIGIDPEIADLREAEVNKGTTNSAFIQSIAEKLPFPSQVFDIVIFASSL